MISRTKNKFHSIRNIQNISSDNKGYLAVSVLNGSKNFAQTSKFNSRQRRQLDSQPEQKKKGAHNSGLNLFEEDLSPEGFHNDSKSLDEDYNFEKEESLHMKHKNVKRRYPKILSGICNHDYKNKSFQLHPTKIEEVEVPVNLEEDDTETAKDERSKTMVRG